MTGQELIDRIIDLGGEQLEVGLNYDDFSGDRATIGEADVHTVKLFPDAYDANNKVIILNPLRQL